MTRPIRSYLRSRRTQRTPPDHGSESAKAPTTAKPKTKVKIVIPIYCTELSEKERRSLQQTLSLLGRHPIVLLAPEGLDLSPLGTCFEGFQTVRVSEEWLGKKNGIAGYNRMMLSREFYALFPDTEYILICQSDCWIFRDELDYWCGRGYDYIGAPSPRRPLYDLLPVRCYLALRRWTARGILRQDLIGSTFNGGLSLRRVESFLIACDTYREAISAFLAQRHHLYNEDVFWSLIPSEFSYPSTDEALGFAFDVKPAYCYERSGNRLPFGCHGWFKEPVYGFWEKIIG